MHLYFNPVSGYSQKVLVAFYEKDIPFTPHIVNLFDPKDNAEYRKITKLGKVPVLKLDNDWMIPESSIIIEYLENHFENKGTRLIPADKDLARRTRFHDRIVDSYINEQIGKIFFDGMRPAGKQDAYGVEHARTTLDTTYEIMDGYFGKNPGPWTLGNDFTMADCAAVPALGYARMVHPFEKHRHLQAYWNRLAERPSVKRVFKEAEPHMQAFMAAQAKK
jgi:glutathione S-transferase